jgi:hypothetical protein
MIDIDGLQEEAGRFVGRGICHRRIMPNLGRVCECNYQDLSYRKSVPDTKLTDRFLSGDIPGTHQSPSGAQPFTVTINKPSGPFACGIAA